MPVTLHTPALDLTQAEIGRWSAIPVAIAVDLVREAGQIDPAIGLVARVRVWLSFPLPVVLVK